MKQILYVCFFLGSFYVNVGYSQSRIPNDVKDIKDLTGRWTSPPVGVIAKGLTRGAILGNGDMGVAVGGDLSTLIFYISKSDFWSAEVNLYKNKVKDPAPLPIGGVSVKVEGPTEAHNYQLEQDIIHAEVRGTSGTASPVETRSVVDMQDNYLITEIWTKSEIPVNVNVETWAKADNSKYPVRALAEGAIATVERTTNSPGFAGAWESKAAICTRIIGTKATLSTDGKSASTFRITLTKGKLVKIVSYLSGGGKQNDAEIGQSHAKLKAASESTLAKQQALSRQWWKSYWSRSTVRLYDKTIERFYYGALYELACSSKNSKVCPGLYGVWTTTDSPSWHNDIHLNYNGEGSFYGVFSSNRPELARSYYDLILDYVPEGERRAREDMYKIHDDLKGKAINGVLFPVGIGPWGTTTDDVYLNQSINAAFSSVIFIWNYEYTGDKAFLRMKAYPFIRKIGNFYEAYLRTDTVNGEKKYVLWTGAHEGTWNKNASLDLGFVRMIFSFLLNASTDLNTDKQERTKWQDILTHLSGFPTAKIDGKTMFTLDDKGWVWPEVNISVLEFIYPAGALSYFSSKDSLAYAHNTINYYTRPGYPGYFNINNFIKIFPIAIQSQYDPEVLIPNFRKVIDAQLQTNLTINDGVHGIEKAGAIDAVNMMLLQSANDLLVLFPYWKKPAAFTNLRAKGAFLVTAEQNGTIKNISITSERGNICNLLNPFAQGIPKVYCMVGNVKKVVSYKLQANIITFDTKTSRRYIVEN